MCVGGMQEQYWMPSARGNTLFRLLCDSCFGRRICSCTEETSLTTISPHGGIINRNCWSMISSVTDSIIVVKEYEYSSQCDP